MSPIDILVVEDSGPVRDLHRVLLATEGYRVTEAINGLEGLQRVEARKPDLIVLDLMMPEVDGEEMLLTLKNREDLADIPVLVVSGIFEAAQRCREILGSDNVFTKPFEPVRLLDRIAELVGHPADEGSEVQSN